MGSFTLVGKAPFGEPNDTVEVDVTDALVHFAHHGATETALRKSGHVGQVTSWNHQLPVSAIKVTKAESPQPVVEKPGLLGRFLGVSAEQPKNTQDDMLLVMTVKLHDHLVQVVLTGKPDDVELLKRKLAKTRPTIRPIY